MNTFWHSGHTNVTVEPNDNGEQLVCAIFDDDRDCIALIDENEERAQWLCDQLNDFETLKVAVTAHIADCRGEFGTDLDKALDKLQSALEGREGETP